MLVLKTQSPVFKTYNYISINYTTNNSIVVLVNQKPESIFVMPNDEAVLASTLHEIAQRIPSTIRPTNFIGLDQRNGRFRLKTTTLFFILFSILN